MRFEQNINTMLLNGTPGYLRSDNGIEFTSSKIRECLKNFRVIAAYIELGFPWESGFYRFFFQTIKGGISKIPVTISVKDAFVQMHKHYLPKSDDICGLVKTTPSFKEENKDRHIKQIQLYD